MSSPPRMRLAAPPRLTLACEPVCVPCGRLPDNGFDDSAKEQMALWKQWMTIEDKASFGRDEWHCRKTPLP